MTQVQPLVTTVTNLVVSPSTYGCTVSCTTSVAVRGQLKWGTASGTYPNASPIGSAPRTQHGTADLLCASGLSPSTLYHYVLQWYDSSGNALDATADATFTTLAAPAPPTPGMGFSGPMTVSGGGLLFSPDNTADIGASGATRPRNVFAGTLLQAPQHQLGTANSLYGGSGAPAAGLGANGDFYFRSDTPGTANQRLYVKSAGAWVGII